MRKFLCLIYACIGIVGIAIAETLNVTWYNTDDTVYDTTTCTVGGTLNLPTAPTKRGYTFQGWRLKYIPIEYIESTGTQYIDTGARFLFGDEFFFDYMQIASISSENKGYGAGTSLSVNITGGGRNNGSNVCMFITGNNSCYNLTYNTSLLNRYTEHWKIDALSGVLASTLTNVSTDETYTLSKSGFGSNYDSGNNILLCRDNSSQYKYPSKIRIYRTWLKRQDGTMAFDFIPVLDDNGVACMYDKVSKTFFYNAGTGNFTAGPIIGE